jgi:hypothetical protein
LTKSISSFSASKLKTFFGVVACLLPLLLGELLFCVDLKFEFVLFANNEEKMLGFGDALIPVVGFELSDKLSLLLINK